MGCEGGEGEAGGRERETEKGSFNLTLILLLKAELYREKREIKRRKRTREDMGIYAQAQSIEREALRGEGRPYGRVEVYKNGLLTWELVHCRRNEESEEKYPDFWLILAKSCLCVNFHLENTRSKSSINHNTSSATIP